MDKSIPLFLIQQDYDAYLEKYQGIVPKESMLPTDGESNKYPIPPWGLSPSPHAFYNHTVEQNFKDNGEYIVSNEPVNYDVQIQKYRQAVVISDIANIHARSAVSDWYTKQLGYNDERFHKVINAIDAIQQIKDLDEIDLRYFNHHIEKRELAFIDLLLRLVQRHPDAEDDILATLIHLFEILANND